MAPTTVIAAFDVPPGREDAFLAGRAPGDGVLHRALRADVPFRFVAVGGDAAGAAHAADYEVVRQDGAPDTEGGVVRIEFFAVGEHDDERFLAAWEEARAALAEQRGAIGTRLYRSPAPARLRFVELARWSSPLMIARADKALGLAPSPHSAHAAMYLVEGR